MAEPACVYSLGYAIAPVQTVSLVQKARIDGDTTTTATSSTTASIIMQLIMDIRKMDTAKAMPIAMAITLLLLDAEQEAPRC